MDVINDVSMDFEMDASQEIAAPTMDPSTLVTARALLDDELLVGLRQA
jgi:hypothetical protein